MTFENTLYDVNTKMEKRAFAEETGKVSLFGILRSYGIYYVS